MSHPSHKTRISDSSLYDEVCTQCRRTDANGLAALNAPCPNAEIVAEDPLSPERIAAAVKELEQQQNNQTAYEQMASDESSSPIDCSSLVMPIPPLNSKPSAIELVEGKKYFMVIRTPEDAMALARFADQYQQALSTFGIHARILVSQFPIDVYELAAKAKCEPNF